MKLFVVMALFVASITYADPPAPYPITVDSQAGSVPSLEMYQGEAYTIRATFKSGGTVEDVSTAQLFCFWATNSTAVSFVTSSWTRVNGGVSGVVDFTFSAESVNTNGDLIYGIGAGTTFKQGALRIRANPYTAGIASPSFTFATNLAGITFVNYPWVDAVTLTESTSNSATVIGNSIQLTIKSDYGSTVNLATLSNSVMEVGAVASGAVVSASTAQTMALAQGVAATNAQATALGVGAGATSLVLSAWSTASNALAVASGDDTDTVARASALAQGVAATNASLTALGVGAGSTSLTLSAWATASNALALASGVGTDATARASIVTVGAVATQALLTAQSPTDTTARASVVDVGLVASNALTLASGADTDLVARASIVYIGAELTGTTAVASNALTAAQQAQNTLSNTSYAVNGQNITGIWYAVGNTDETSRGGIFSGYANKLYGGQYSVIAGGWENVITNAAANAYAFIGGGFRNTNGGLASVVVGGFNNIVSTNANGAFIGGGFANRAVEAFATIPGGYGNYATSNSFAAGTGARATNVGSFVWSGAPNLSATFGSIGDNTFNAKSIGGTYFLSPDFFIQDTNGATVARFSATNSIINGDLNLTGYGTTQAIAAADLAQGVGATNIALSVGAGATNLALAVGAGATNATLAIGAGSTNLSLSIGAGATNAANSAGLVATNADLRAIAAQEYASNINFYVWSNTVNAGGQTLTNVKHLAFAEAAPSFVPNSIGTYGGYLRRFLTTNTYATIFDTANATSFGLQSVASFNATITNYWRIVATAPTGATSVGTRGDMNVSGTNGYAYDGTRWHRWNTTTNWP